MGTPGTASDALEPQELHEEALMVAFTFGRTRVLRSARGRGDVGVYWVLFIVDHSLECSGADIVDTNINWRDVVFDVGDRLTDADGAQNLTL